MPILQDLRREAFAKARAGGARLEDAYEDAGFEPDRAHACRLAKLPEVAARIAELRRENAGPDEAGALAVIAALLQMAKAGEGDTTPAAIKERRQNLLEAHRLCKDLALERDADRFAIRIECA